MGLDIDSCFNSDSYLNIATIRSSIDNVQSVLSLYDRFDHSIRRLNVSRCSKILLECYKKISETFGSGFDEAQFRSRYTSIPMNTYSLFAVMYAEVDFLSQCLTQYFGETSNKYVYLEFVVHSQRDLAEIYETVLKEGSSEDGGHLVDNLLDEFFKKAEILIKVLFYLTFQSFRFLGNQASDINSSIPNDFNEDVRLADLITCYVNMNLFGYFTELLEAWCKHYLDFDLPPSVAELANKYACQFNINLHLKLFCKDPEFSQALNRELAPVLDVINNRLLYVQSYLKSIQSMYSSVDSKNLCFGRFEFDSESFRDFLSGIIWNFFENFCHTLSPFLSIVEAIEVVEGLRYRFESNGIYTTFEYLDTYLNIAYKNWEDRLLSYLRTLCLEQYNSPVSMSVNVGQGDNSTHLDFEQDLFTKEVNYETVIEAFNTVFGQFLTLTLENVENNHFLSSDDSNRMFGADEDFSFLTKDEGCVVSNNLYSIMMVLLKLLLMPVFLNYELMHLIPDHLTFGSDLDQNSGCGRNSRIVVDKSRIIMNYIGRNSSLIQSSLLLYIFNSNTSFKNFLYSISRFESLGHSAQDIVKVFLVYMSDVYYLNHLVSMIPYLAQYAYYVYYRNYTATAITCSYRQLNELVKNSYKVSLISVSLCNLQDYLTVHLSAFNQQYVQKLVFNAFNIMYHTSTECFGEDVETYLGSFDQLLETCLAPKVYRSAYNICVDLIFNTVVYECLEFFENINYKFNRQFVSKVKAYVEELYRIMEVGSLKYQRCDFMYEKKFENLVKLFSYEYNVVNEDLYFPIELSKLNRLTRYLKLL